jgi:hypothetical protein
MSKLDDFSTKDAGVPPTSSPLSSGSHKILVPVQHSPLIPTFRMEVWGLV